MCKLLSLYLLYGQQWCTEKGDEGNISYHVIHALPRHGAAKLTKKKKETNRLVRFAARTAVCGARNITPTIAICLLVFFFFPIPIRYLRRVFAFLFSLPPVRNSEPWSRNGLSFPPPHYSCGSCLAFNPFLPSSTPE